MTTEARPTCNHSSAAGTNGTREITAEAAAAAVWGTTSTSSNAPDGLSARLRKPRATGLPHRQHPVVMVNEVPIGVDDGVEVELKMW